MMVIGLELSSEEWRNVLVNDGIDEDEKDSVRT